MNLGRATYSLTIPSLSDGLELDCRVYHPRPSEKQENSSHLLKFALIAHPYAPLGGSFNDGVVGIVGGTLLKAGYIVGTFNFRGAPGSEGKTSWSGRAELSDYLSFYGFMLCYAAHLRLQSESTPPPFGDETIRELGLSNGNGNEAELPPLEGTVSSEIVGRVICAGYSYGSVIARHVPTADYVIDLFSKAFKGSMQEEIYLRAQHLAMLHRQTWFQPRSNTSSHRNSRDRSIAIGGREANSSQSTPSRYASQRSFDFERVKKSIEKFRDRRASRSRTSNDGESIFPDFTSPLNNLPLETAYLLISPPIGILASVITSFFTPSFDSKVGSYRLVQPPANQDSNHCLVNNQSFAIWGQDDFLQPSRHSRKWAESLSSQPNSKFKGIEVPTAGHFWREEGVAEQLRKEVAEWLRYIDG